MGPAESSLYGIVDKVRSWIPRRSEPSDSARTFWMPDQSCRVCYECDSPFTIFNRRHHCRACGRVFCGRCTENTIPAGFAEGWKYADQEDRIRVCKFCFKLWEQETVNSQYNGIPVLSPAISPSPSLTSLASTESSSNSSSNNSSVRSIMPFSTVPYQHINYSNTLNNPVEADGLASAIEKNQSKNTNANIDTDLAMEGANTSSAIGIPTKRSDDDDDEFRKASRDSVWQDTRRSEKHYGEDGSVESSTFNKVNNNDFTSQNSMDPTKNPMELIAGRSLSPTIGLLAETQLPRTRERSGEESEGTDNGNESNDESSMYGASNPELEQPMDIENNGSIWIPPEPEDEEDEKETTMFDDDDDDYDGGGWALPRSTGSFSDSEYRSKDRANEEHRKAMKAVVDGHFRALVAQLLKGDDVLVGEENDKDGWLEIVTSLSWQAASLVKPDTSKGGGMDPGGYVKVKCIACGRRSESEVIKGVVCKKNVAHRRMTTRYKNPRVLILGGALEYQRQSNLLSSLDTLLQQEMDHLKMTVAKIEAHHPNVLLVEKTVSRHAQDYLLAKEISLVLNVKRPLLERISRCTGAQIVPSVDNLTTPKVGHCEAFHVSRFREDHGSAGEPGKRLVKTLMFFEGCPKPLGCTVLLKGANGDELKKVKRVVQYAVFAAYHLALETSFLADEGATIPQLPLKTPINVALPDKPSNLDRSISTIPGFMLPSSGQPNPSDMKFSPQLSRSGHLVSELSCSIKQTFEAVPSICSRSHKADATCYEFEEKILNDSFIDNGLNMSFPSESPFGYEMYTEDKLHDLQMRNMESNEDLLNAKFVMDQKITKYENLDSVHSDGRQGYSKEDFPPSPSDQQSILVSLSTRCVWKGTICERAHLFRIKYYGSFDKPLGKFLRETLFDQNYRCVTSTCDAPTEAHVRCYTHQQGSLTIAVKRLDETILPGEKEGKIWMWHLCLKCARKTKNPHPTRRVLMSDAAWGLSFGKFLELSFSNHAAASRAASCGHSLHRDCLRFYGFGRMVACFRYAPIHVHSVHLPPPKLEFNDPNQQEWLRKEASDVEDKGELLFAEVFNSLRQIGEKIASSGSFYAGVKVPESRRQTVEFEARLLKDKAEFEGLLRKCTAKVCKPGQPVADILELYRLRRLLILKSYAWDQQLQILAASLRMRRSIGSSVSSISGECYPSVQKDNNCPSLQEKLLETNVLEKDKDASKIVIPTADRNGCPLDGNVENSSGVSDKLQSWDIPITNIQDRLQLPLLDKNLSVMKDMDDRSGVVGKNMKALENHRPQLVHHVETNVSNLNKDSSTIDQTPLHHTPGKNIYRNEASGILQENQHMEFVNGGDEGNLGVHSTSSEGNFKVVDLSDTLDAAWIGEGQSAVPQPVQETLQGHEAGSAALAIENSRFDTESALRNDLKTAVLPSVKTELQEHMANGQDTSESERLQVSAPTSPVKSDDTSMEFGSWIEAPFSILYKAYNKSSQGYLSGFPPRFESLSSYTPSFLSPVSQLGDHGGARLYLPEGVNNIAIAVYDDEPTSIIAYALTSQEYNACMSDKMTDRSKPREKDKEKENGDSFVSDTALFHPLLASEVSDFSEGILKDRSYGSDDSFTSGSKGTGVADPFLYAKAMHVKVSFGDDSPAGKVKYMVTCYYAKQFDALRKKCCPSELDFICSLCRCKKWGAQGGKSNVFFAKTLDDRFIIKQVTKTELESFIKFAPEYFKYLSDSLSTGSPTCLAKILGIYQVTTKHLKGGKEVRMDLMVMENLLFGRNVTRLYDLKGSSRSRYNPDSTGSNKVLLDQNLIEAMPTSPIFVGNKAKRLLERAVWNDTSFLASIDVMDYSLLVGVDEGRHELVLGIIDFMRQYTWDKHLESWVKASGILGGLKNTSPTVVSPKMYKKRFRKAMSTYFLMLPDQWTPPTVTSSNSQPDLSEDVVPTLTQGDGESFSKSKT